MYLNYNKDHKKADTDYKEKALVVTGTVDNKIVNKSGTTAMLFFKTPSDKVSILATGGEEFALKTLEVKELETVTVLCKGDGVVTGAPQLVECSVI